MGDAQSPVSRRVAKNSSSMVAANLATLLISFIAFPVIIRYIGLSLYGVWVILWGLVSMLTILDLGVGGTFVTQLSMALARRDLTEIRQILTLSILFYLALAVLFSPLFFVLTPYLPIWLHIPAVQWRMAFPLVWWLYAYVFLSQAFGSLGALAFASQRIVLVSGLGIAGQLLNSGLLIALLLFHVGLASFVWALYVSWLLPTVVYFAISIQTLHAWPFSKPWPLPGELLRRLASFGGWMQINRLSNQITNEIDRFLIGIYVNTAAAGVFQIAYRVTRIAKQLPNNLTMALLPVISHWEATDARARIVAGYRDTSRYVAAATFFLGVFFWSGERLVFHLWLKHHYPGQFIALGLLTITIVINNLTGAGTTILRGIGKPRLESYYAIVNAVAKLVLSFSLASSLKLEGILLGTAVGTILGSFYFLYLFFRQIHLSWREGLWSWIAAPSAAAVISGVVLWGLTTVVPLPPGRLTSLILLMACGVVYSLLFFFTLRILGFYQPEDGSRMRRILPERVFRLAQKMQILPRF